MQPFAGAAGDFYDVRQTAGNGFSVDADLGGRVHLRQSAHDMVLDDLLVYLVQNCLGRDALPVAARVVLQLLRQSQPRSNCSVTPFVPAARRALFVEHAGSVEDNEHPDVILCQIDHALVALARFAGE